MTEEEFKQQAIPIFAAGPSPEGVDAMRTLMHRANETISVARIAILAAEALDEAYPQVLEMLEARGEPTAAQRMAVEVAKGNLKNRLDHLN